MTSLERTLARALEEALVEIEHELTSAGPEEVAEHPMLRAKMLFVVRARRLLARVNKKKGRK